MIKNYSQYNQDLWVESMLPIKNGFFVELGARDGIKTSNTLYLEKRYNWSGILVECSITNYKNLRINRSGCKIDKRAIYKVSNKQVDFHISKLSTGLNSIFHPKSMLIKDTIKVTTITLSDLLKYHSAPNNIDYISLDIEGAELYALQGFNWDYNVKLWTIEYNDNRKEIQNIMFNQGYSIYKPDNCNVEDWWYKK